MFSVRRGRTRGPRRRVVLARPRWIRPPWGIGRRRGARRWVPVMAAGVLAVTAVPPMTPERGQPARPPASVERAAGAAPGARQYAADARRTPAGGAEGAGTGIAALHRPPGVAAPTAPAGASATRPPAKPPTLTWRSCGDPLFPRLQCASLKVPLDYSAPDGRQITIRVSRMRAPRGAADGVLVVNPGGPGASGLTMAGDIAGRLPKEISRDVIGFDPRGVGASRPAISCVPRYFAPVRPDYVPSSRREERVWLRRVRDYAAACGRKYGWLLPHLTTVNVARDLDRIRAALGQKTIGYLGYSYGTYLGVVYGQLFPRRLDRMVLDSVVDPGRVWYDANLDQNHAFDRRIKEFFGWIARHHRTYRLGSTAAAVEKRWYRLREALGRKPARGRIGSSELDDTFMAAGYDSTAWPMLGEAFSAQVHRRGSRSLINAYNNLGRVGGDGENGYAVYTAVGCRDAPWPRDWSRWRRDAERIRATAPFLAWNNTWYNAPCAFWPVPALRPPPITGEGTPPTLLVQAERDAATPREGAFAMRRLLPSARLLVETGGGDHGVTLSGNRCIDRHVFRYLDRGTLPGPGRGDAARLRGLGGPGAAARAPRGPIDRADATCPAPDGPKPAPETAGARDTGRAFSRCPVRLPYADGVPHGNCR